jgi:hypothetical protein
MPAVRFNGGSLDGGTLDLARCVTSVVTTGGNYYEIDDSGEFSFTGHRPFGREASMVIRWNRDEDQAVSRAAEEAAKPRGCRLCGRTFGGESAWTVHFEEGPGSRCLPGDAYGQLVNVDGVWLVAGSR